MVGIDGAEFVMADIPGLIEGAHEGAGIGHRFLGHVERCRVLLHLIDCTHTDPIASWRTIRTELAAYDENLAAKPEIIALSKTDAAPEGYLDDLRDALKAEGAENILYLSSVTGDGVPEVLRALRRVIDQSKQDELKANTPEAEWHPADM